MGINFLNRRIKYGLFTSGIVITILVAGWLFQQCWKPRQPMAVATTAPNTSAITSVDSTEFYTKHQLTIPIPIEYNEIRETPNKFIPTYSDVKGVLLDGTYAILHQKQVRDYDLYSEFPFSTETGQFEEGVRQGKWHTHFLGTGEELDYSETYRDGRLDGLYTVYNADKTTRYQVNLYRGTGVWKSFYATGQPKLAGTYQKGLEQGVWREYKPDGTLKEETRYEHGVIRKTRTY